MSNKLPKEVDHEKSCTMIAVFTLLMTCLINTDFVSIAYAQSEGNFIFPAESNSIWVLNKSTLIRNKSYSMIASSASVDYLLTGKVGLKSYHWKRIISESG